MQTSKGKWRGGECLLKGSEEERECPALAMVSKTEQSSKNCTALKKKKEPSRKPKRKTRRSNKKGSYMKIPRDRGRKRLEKAALLA